MTKRTLDGRTAVFKHGAGRGTKATQPEEGINDAMAPPGRTGFIIAAAALLSLPAVGLIVDWGGLAWADERALLLLRAQDGNGGFVPGPRWLTQFLTDLTALGGISLLAPITLVISAYLWATGRPHTGLFLTLTVATGWLLSRALKSLYVRGRPEAVPHLVEVSSASFPSGHAMNSAIVYLTLAAILAEGREQPTKRQFLYLTAVALVFLIGLSRLYLGVHYPTDVLAGWSFGAGWAILCWIAASRFREGSPPHLLRN